MLCNTYHRENPEAPARYMWSYYTVPELNSQNRRRYENLDMDVCDSDWDIGERNAESKAEQKEVRVKNI